MKMLGVRAAILKLRKKAEQATKLECMCQFRLRKNFLLKYKFSIFKTKADRFLREEATVSGYKI
jgi:hypothetical protein